MIPHDPVARRGDPYCHSVSVAAVIVRRNDGGVLAIKRRDSGAWQPPGGVLEPDEDIVDGLVREASEEAGVIVRAPQLTGVYKHVGRPIVSLVFLCEIRRRVWRRERTTGDETVDVRWMTRAEVIERMDPVFAPRVLDALDHRDRPAVRSHNGLSWTWAWQRYAARRFPRALRSVLSRQRALVEIHQNGSLLRRYATFAVVPGLALGFVLSIFMSL